MKEYTYSEALQDLLTVLDSARKDGRSEYIEETVSHLFLRLSLHTPLLPK